MIWNLTQDLTISSQELRPLDQKVDLCEYGMAYATNVKLIGDYISYRKKMYCVGKCL